MPEFFPFIPGTETGRAARQHASDASPLLGRFRAVPPSRNPRAGQQQQQIGLLSSGGRGSVHVGYGALIAAAGLEGDYSDEEEDDDEDEDADDDDDGGNNRGCGGILRRTGRSWRRFVRLSRRSVRDLWIAPRQPAVKRVVEKWWSRWGVLVFLPAALAVAWCALPFPQYPLSPSHSRTHPQPHEDPKTGPDSPSSDHRVPGHGEARVQVNFWFFLFVYYGFYNLTALIWITKVFNLYSLNWWPSTLGFPLTVSLIAVVSLAAPIPVYLIPEARYLTIHNTAWISWTFVIMAMPVAIAFCILMTHERHLGLRHSLSETQRIFTSSWWTGGGKPDNDNSALSASRNHNNRRRGFSLDADAALQVADQSPRRHRMPALLQRRRWLPASFVRFVWFCLALFVGLLAYLAGEAYAEIYLRTLPHNSFETIVYVYSWVVTVHLLDALTGWILGASEGERVGSYPLSWIFKLYFMLTYQTYVRALYARLRSPQQFVWLQGLSSGFLIVLTPLTMTQTYHRVLSMVGLTGQSYASYQKIRTRDVFIRSLAENVSMLAFLGSILALHFGPNKHVYPYFAFDDPDELYDFELTFYASAVTWACELAAGIVLRQLIRWVFGVNASAEGKMDLAVWPELLPTSVAVTLHVLQSMLFSIIRLHFR
ncbi:peroxisome assembly protein (Peroxin-2) [Hypoxylon texense]